MTPESLSRLLEDFLGGSRHAVVREDGARIFDLADSKYSVSGEYNKCLLHLWSAERNAVRRILDAEVRNSNLRLMVQKLGQSRPSKLEICKGHDFRTPTARKATLGLSAAPPAGPGALSRFHRGQAQQCYRPRALVWPDLCAWRTAPGPDHVRCVGRESHETQSSIDAALTFAILWLDACRNSENHRPLVEGV